MGTSFKSQLLQDLYSRGYLYQFTNLEAIDDLFCSDEKISFYVGYDPTATSLHIGQLLWIKLVKYLQANGHKPIVLVGEATGRIGDPTWKDSMRKMLDKDTVEKNIHSINNKLEQLLGKNVQVVNNDTWLSKINYMDFLREFGPMFSVNKMLSMDSVKMRLEREQHLSFLEFNYMLLQAYDFYYLHNKYNCILEIGGQDQWSNIISGVDLIRRKSNTEVFGMSIPLLLNSNGKKMGKTESGAIWLNENMCSPFDFWQFWRNVNDKEVIKYLKLFSNLPISEIEKLSKYVGSKEINNAKILLANEVTKFVHPKVNLDDIQSAASNKIESDEIEQITINTSSSLDKALVLAGFVDSFSQAKRLIDGNGVKVDNQVKNDYKFMIEKDCLISVGKKKLKKIVIKS